MFKKLALILAFLLISIDAQAAVTANALITPQAPNLGVVQFLQGTDSAGTYKTVFTAAANGSVLKALWTTNNDASATHLITCQIVRSAVFYGGVALTSVSSAGYVNATAQQNFMSPVNWVGLPLDSDGNPILLLKSGDTIQCTFATSLTTSDYINIVAIGADY